MVPAESQRDLMERGELTVATGKEEGLHETNLTTNHKPTREGNPTTQSGEIDIGMRFLGI